MISATSPAVVVVRRVILTVSWIALVPLPAQTAASAAPSPAALAQYDKNHNGILDPDELAKQQTDEVQRGEVVALTPFEVSTSKDIGYAAGNTLSGGRVDTPLAITPGSISVMTKEFLDDFNITSINDAAAWTIGMDMGTVTPNSAPGTEATYQALFRGAPADQNYPTRNGSLNFGTADSYNSERFEFSRGPDTSMFGDGGPGGRQGSSSKRARLNSTATTLAMQVDTFGGYRTTLDYNKGWNRLALRFNGLRQDLKPYQPDLSRIKTAATIGATFKLTENTQLIADFERVAEWNNLFSLTYADNAQFWNNTTVNNDNTLIANPNSLGLEQVSATVDYFSWNFGLNELVNYRGTQYRTRGTGFRIPYTGNPNIPASTARPFPAGISRKFNASAVDNIIDRDSDTLALTVEHRARNLFLQAGVVKNNFDINTIWTNGSGPNEYRVDVNRLLPDGRPNPNFLKGYAETDQNRDYQQDAVREFKGLATYRFFLPKFFDYKQQLSLNGGFRQTNAERRSDGWRRADNPLQPDALNAANILRLRYYWDAPRPKLSPVLTDPNKVMPGRWVLAQTAGNVAKRDVTYGGIVSQSAFFNEKVAVTASIRRDNVSVDAMPRFGSTGAPDYKNVLGSGAPGVHIKRERTVTSTAYGLVAYPFQTGSEGMKRWLSPLGFVFNFAENNQPPGSGAQAPLISGEEAPLTHSKTSDLGVRYSVPGGKVYLTVSHYNTDQEDIVGGFGSQGDIRNIWLNLGYADPKLTTTEFNYSDLSARKLEGWEVELTANPWRTLTLTANYSHPITKIQSESVDRKAYIAEHLAEWQAGAALANGALVPGGGGRTIRDSQLIRDALLNIENSLNGLTTGTLGNDSTVHRINVAARYAFREGRLRGLAVNAGMNYRSHTKSGSRDARIKFGLPDNVNPTPQQNVAAAFDYLWVPPTNTVSAGANYTRRFGKYQARFQLNVTNLLDSAKPVWGRNTTPGSGGLAYSVLTTNQLLTGNPRMQVLAGFAAVDPRKITFSTTVSF